MSTEIAATRRPRKSRPGRDGPGHHAAAGADLNGRLAGELSRVAHVVGEECRITQRASIGNVSGLWALGSIVTPTCDREGSR